MVEHGINWLHRDGCTLLHCLIDNNLGMESLHMRGLAEFIHGKRKNRFKGCKIFACRQMFVKRHGQQRHPYLSQCNVSLLRQALKADSVTAAQVRSSPCKCGIGTIFLAISTENVEAVEALLDFDPDLANDRYHDGSSTLGLASCIHHAHTRQRMIDLILS